MISFKKFFQLRLLSEERILVPEVNLALKDWIKNSSSSGVLIGGLAYSLYAKPRQTTDIDLIYISDSEIPKEVKGFKRVREHSFVHLKTHCEVEVLSPSFLKVPKELFQRVLETAKENESFLGSGMKVASPEGIAALKLFRGSLKDFGDIEGLIESGLKIDLSSWPIPEEKWNKVEELLDQFDLKLREKESDV